MGAALPPVLLTSAIAELVIMHEFVSMSRDFSTLIETRGATRARREQYL
jgi:hypothetical protein